MRTPQHRSAAAQRTVFMPWVLPAMLALVAAGVMLSGRDLSQMYAELAAGGNGSYNPAMDWLQRGVSVLLLLASGERILRFFGSGRPLPSVPLVASYSVYWVATVAFTALLGAHPSVGHEYAYSLVIGFAMMLTTGEELPAILQRARDALFVLMVVSVALVPVDPSMVLDASYTQGLLPGVPRLGGVAPHPVALGMFAQTGLLLLCAYPYRSRLVNLMAWGLGLGVLFFAQSKTAWIAFVLCSACLLLVRGGARAWQRLGDPRDNSFGILACLGAMLVGAGLLVLLVFDDVGDKIASFFDTQEGAQLMSLTGRDQIWAVAWEEWHAHPWFGYGPTLWDEDFRNAIAMPNATSAHNQFMDTLARSGTVGAIALVVYAAVLLWLSLRHARDTRGLSIALFIALALRSVSEVPLLLFGYGSELFIHLLLVVTLAAGAAQRRGLAAAPAGRRGSRVARPLRRPA